MIGPTSLRRARFLRPPAHLTPSLSARRRASFRLAACVVASALALTLGGCEDDGAGPGSLRFGQIGEVQLRVETPLRQGTGSLEQRLAWSSEGPFQLEESIAYFEELGDRTVVREIRNPEVLAGSYAGWIAQVNEVESLRLFIDELDPSLDPVCGPGRSRVTLRIRDDVRDESVSWIRCALGGLHSLSTASAGPDPSAARVVAAAILLRDRSLGEDFRSAYQGSVPFGTIAKGEGSSADLPNPRSITDAGTWQAFWEEHTGREETAPPVDFERDLVLVGAVGVRPEAGDSVEVRRVLPVDGGTVVTLVEQVPGDFCSPAERLQTPFHIVRAPRVPLPIEFADPVLVRVPCGQ